MAKRKQQSVPTIRDRVKELRRVRAGDLRPSPRNWRTHPQAQQDALCGYDGEHVMPPSWECVRWKAHGGYAQVNTDGESAAHANRFRERVWFSPHCPRPERLNGA